MANKKITALTALTSAADDDVLAIVDVSETSVSSTGETKKITKANLVTGVSLTSDVTGVLPEANGGTNQSAYAKGERVDVNGWLSPYWAKSSVFLMQNKPRKTGQQQQLLSVKS